MDLLRQLAARLAAADDENLARRQRRGVRITFGVDDLKRGPQRLGPERPVGPLVSAGGEHHRAGLEVAAGGPQRKAPAALERNQGVDLDTRADRRGETLRVAFQVGDQALLGQEAIRVRSLVPASRQLERPVGKHQGEAVPASTPGLPDGAPLEHEVRDPQAGQLMADGETGLTCPHDDHLGLVDHEAPFNSIQEPGGVVKSGSRRHNGLPPTSRTTFQQRFQQPSEIDAAGGAPPP